MPCISSASIAFFFILPPSFFFCIWSIRNFSWKVPTVCSTIGFCQTPSCCPLLHLRGDSHLQLLFTAALSKQSLQVDLQNRCKTQRYHCRDVTTDFNSATYRVMYLVLTGLTSVVLTSLQGFFAWHFVCVLPVSSDKDRGGVYIHTHTHTHAYIHTHTHALGPRPHSLTRNDQRSCLVIRAEAAVGLYRAGVSRVLPQHYCWPAPTLTHKTQQSSEVIRTWSVHKVT